MKSWIAGVLFFSLAACTSMGGEERSIGGNHLIIAQFPEYRELGRYPLGPDKIFSLSFIHSVSKTRVKDLYEVRTGGIVQTQEIFKAHGAGLPSNADEPGGRRFEKKGDTFVLHMERAIPCLVVRTDKMYENRLELPSGTINLNQWEDQALFIGMEPSNCFDPGVSLN